MRARRSNAVLEFTQEVENQYGVDFGAPNPEIDFTGTESVNANTFSNRFICSPSCSMTSISAQSNRHWNLTLWACGLQSPKLRLAFCVSRFDGKYAGRSKIERIFGHLPWCTLAAFRFHEMHEDFKKTANICGAIGENCGNGYLLYSLGVVADEKEKVRHGIDYLE